MGILEESYHLAQILIRMFTYQSTTRPELGDGTSSPNLMADEMKEESNSFINQEIKRSPTNINESTGSLPGEKLKVEEQQGRNRLVSITNKVSNRSVSPASTESVNDYTFLDAKSIEPLVPSKGGSVSVDQAKGPCYIDQAKGLFSKRVDTTAFQVRAYSTLIRGCTSHVTVTTVM